MKIYLRKVEISEDSINSKTNMIFSFSIDHFALANKEFNFFEFLYNKSKSKGYIDDEDIVSAALILQLRGAKKE